MVYVLYIPATDVFTDDHEYFFKAVDLESQPLPADVKASVKLYLKEIDETLLAVVGIVSLSPTSYAVIGVGMSGRWQITVEWSEGEWKVVSKQPYN